MLEAVGLSPAAKRRVGQYSLGMRQRLGIAAALLGDPAALILDEPANGMDPEGIRWMRGLLQDFAARGGTVILSSHLLGEVQATVDRLVVIGGGRIVANGSLEELLAGSGTLVRGLDPIAPEPGADRRRAQPRAAAGRRAPRRRHRRAGRPRGRRRRPDPARTARERRRRPGGALLPADQPDRCRSRLTTSKLSGAHHHGCHRNHLTARDCGRRASTGPLAPHYRPRAGSRSSGSSPSSCASP